MKNKRIVFAIALITVTVIALYCFTACSNKDKEDSGNIFPGTPDGISSLHPSESDIDGVATGENPIINTSEQNDLYFSIDTNTAGYTQLKNIILESRYYSSLRQYVKIDQMLNYFDYDYSTPQGDELLAINASMFNCPYNDVKKLLRIGLAAKQVELESVQNNIVLLLDVSGSMYGSTKINLMKQAMLQAVDQFNLDDCISIVTYSDDIRVVVDGMTMRDNCDEIKRKIGDLRADGLTNGAGGIQKAYEVAKNHLIEGGNNRVILATDGDFNVGISDPAELREFIAEKRDDGIYLTCIGLGSNSDYSISVMEALAKCGNGYWGYIHDMDDAKKLLVDDIASTVITIAKDVKAKIVFNSENVKNFRLLGYENSILSSDDYQDNTTDAGEIGTGFTLSLCFEIELNDGVDLSQDIDIANVNIRYKDANSTPEDTSSELDLPIDSSCYTTSPSQDDRFVSCVVEFALLLLDSRYKADANLNNVIARLGSMEFGDKYKTQFVQIVNTYKNNLGNTNLR